MVVQGWMKINYLMPLCIFVFIILNILTLKIFLKFILELTLPLSKKKFITLSTKHLLLR